MRRVLCPQAARAGLARGRGRHPQCGPHFLCAGDCTPWHSVDCTPDSRIQRHEERKYCTHKTSRQRSSDGAPGPGLDQPSARWQGTRSARGAAGTRAVRCIHDWVIHIEHLCAKMPVILDRGSFAGPARSESGVMSVLQLLASCRLCVLVTPLYVLSLRGQGHSGCENLACGANGQLAPFLPRYCEAV